MGWPCFATALAVLSLASANVGDARQPKAQPISFEAEFSGKTTGQQIGLTSLLITASGTGHSPQFGQLTTVASWLVDFGLGSQLLAGAVDALPLNVGTLIAKLETGDTLIGSFSGTVRRVDDRFFTIEAKFEVIAGTGVFKNLTGKGNGAGTLDLQTFDYSGTVSGVLKSKNDKDRGDD
jgi:hypothetical protein